MLGFEGTPKGLILNRTNANTIADLYGPDVDGWVGKQVVLYIEKNVPAFGKKWDVIRIQSAPVESVAAAGPTLDESLLPF